MTYIKGLDTLRAFAVLIVILHHFGPAPSDPILNFLFHTALPDGVFGVDLFFVLSGFLITSVLLEAIEKREKTSNKTIIKNFIIRRALRLFPIYYLLLIFLYLFNYPDIRNNFLYFSTYTSNFLILFTQSWNSFSHTWSLAIEEQFYLIWPWVIVFTPRKYLVHAILFFIQLGILSSIITSYQFSPFFQRTFGEFSSIFTVNCFHALAIGALLAVSRKDERLRILVPKVFLYLLPAALILYVLNRATNYTHFNVNAFVRLINAVLSVNIIAYVVKHDYSKLAERILHNKIFLQLGKISYGIYLYHYVIGESLATHFDPRINLNSPIGNQYLFSLLVITITVGVAFLSYYTVESYFLSFKKYFSGGSTLRTGIRPAVVTAIMDQKSKQKID